MVGDLVAGGLKGLVMVLVLEGIREIGMVKGWS